MLEGKYNYSDPGVRLRIEQLTSDAEAGPHFIGGRFFTHSWLRQYDFWLEQLATEFDGGDSANVISISEVSTSSSHTLKIGR